MTRLLFLFLLIFFILLIFNYNAKKRNKNSGIYKKLIIALIIFAVIFLLATSGRFILPQILQILKIGAPFLTKFIGL